MGPPEPTGAQSRAQGQLLRDNPHLSQCGISALISLPYCPCLSADRPPSSKVPQQPPVPPQRPMAVLPPPPAGRSHTVGLLAFFPGAVSTLIPPLPERREEYTYLHPVLTSMRGLYIGGEHANPSIHRDFHSRHSASAFSFYHKQFKLLV